MENRNPGAPSRQSEHQTDHTSAKGAPLTRVDPSVGGDGGDGEGGDGGDHHREQDDDARQHCRPRQSASYVSVEDTLCVSVEDKSCVSAGAKLELNAQT